MKRLILTAQEARDLAAGTLAEIRRPFRNPNPVGDHPKAIFPDGSGKGWVAWWGRGPFTAEWTRRAYPGNQGVPSPFGAPGDLLWCAESWRSWEQDCNDDHDGMPCGAHCHQVYVAYETTPKRGYRPVPDRAAITYLHESTPVTDDPRLCGPWKRAVTMPRWASRFTLRLAAVRVERVGDVWTWIGAVERMEGAK